MDHRQARAPNARLDILGLAILDIVEDKLGHLID
jgi:hypothetical protein